MEDIQVKIEKLKVENIDHKRHINKLEEFKEDGEVFTLEDIKEGIKKGQRGDQEGYGTSQYRVGRYC